MPEKKVRKVYKTRNKDEKEIIIRLNAKTFNNPKSILIGKKPAKEPNELNNSSVGMGLYFPNFLYTDFKLNIPMLYRH